MHLALLTLAVSRLAVGLVVPARTEGFERLSWGAGDAGGEVLSLLVARSGAGLAAALRFGGISFLFCGELPLPRVAEPSSEGCDGVVGRAQQ